MALADELADFFRCDTRLALFVEPRTGIVAWWALEPKMTERLTQQLPTGMISTVMIETIKRVLDAE